MEFPSLSASETSGSRDIASGSRGVASGSRAVASQTWTSCFSIQTTAHVLER